MGYWKQYSIYKDSMMFALDRFSQVTMLGCGIKKNNQKTYALCTVHSAHLYVLKISPVMRICT